MELKKPISPRKRAFAAPDPLLGVKNGKKSGMRLGIARISVGRSLNVGPDSSCSLQPENSTVMFECKHPLK